MSIQEPVGRQGSLNKTQEYLERYAFDLLRAWPRYREGSGGARAELEERVRDLRRHLARTAIFRHALKQLRESPPPADGWAWQTLLETPHVSAGLLHLAARAHIPFHDHPGSIDALLVIDGEVEVRSYSPTSNVLAIGQQAAHLKPVDYQRLAEDQVSLALPDHGNIHGLRCLADGAILLDVQVNPDGRPGERRWYFPLGASSQDPGHIIAAAVPESLLRSAVGCPATD